MKKNHKTRLTAVAFAAAVMLGTTGCTDVDPGEGVVIYGPPFADGPNIPTDETDTTAQEQTEGSTASTEELTTDEEKP